jgi:hypothetical protein
MAVQSAHPSAFELAYRLYDRAIHPELFAFQRACRLTGTGWTADVRIVAGGHVVSLCTTEGTATEVAGPARLPLPDRGLCLGHTLGGSRDWTFQLPGGLKAQVSAHVEAVDAAAFRNLEQELTLDARTATVSHRFSVGNRMEPGPISVIRAESVANGILIHAFHTFPGNSAVVRTQSLYELTRSLSGLVDVYSAADSLQAYFLSDLLAGEGIEAFVVGDHSAYAGVNAIDPPRIRVLEHDKERAREILVAWDAARTARARQDDKIDAPDESAG